MSPPALCRITDKAGPSSARLTRAVCPLIPRLRSRCGSGVVPGASVSPASTVAARSASAPEYPRASRSPPVVAAVAPIVNDDVIGSTPCAALGSPNRLRTPSRSVATASVAGPVFVVQPISWARYPTGSPNSPNGTAGTAAPSNCVSRPTLVSTGSNLARCATESTSARTVPMRLRRAAPPAAVKAVVAMPSIWPTDGGGNSVRWLGTPVGAAPNVRSTVAAPPDPPS